MGANTHIDFSEIGSEGLEVDRLLLGNWLSGRHRLLLQVEHNTTQTLKQRRGNKKKEGGMVRTSEERDKEKDQKKKKKKKKT